KDLAGQESLQPLATKICAAVRGLDAIVRDVLSFAREIRLRPTVLALEDLLAGALADCGGLLEEAGVEVAPLRVSPVEGGVVADASLLKVVCSNLIRNAAEAMAEMPGSDQHPRTLEIRAGLETGSEGEAVVIRFLDRGPGVSPEVRERMCNPFFTTRAAGTGLGLAIVHRILEAHGASLEVQSRGDGLGGAEFIIRLPREGKSSRDVETHG
ncbi:MAG: sensor histidine kinase, partial [Phycisphaerales bacterium JB038]